VDTAPEWLGDLRLEFRPTGNTRAQLEWVYTDGYWLDAANQHWYGGDSLLNLRLFQAWPHSGHSLALRITNLLDTWYADRADYAFGDYRYFPGAGRRFFLEWRYSHQNELLESARGTNRPALHRDSSR